MYFGQFQYSQVSNEQAGWDNQGFPTTYTFNMEGKKV